MMKETNLAQNIASLRKKKGITQEQLASALNISPQAVSKWETGICLPDTQTLPLIADYFQESIDYLFYGKHLTYNDLYQVVMEKTKSYEQMSVGSYEEALKLFAAAHHGISKGNLLHSGQFLNEEPAHISSAGGVSLLSGNGYGAIVTRKFFENVSFAETIPNALSILGALADETRLKIIMAIISMSDISLSELCEKLHTEKEKLEEAIKPLIQNHIVIVKLSKHKAIEKTYNINEMCHSCLCILLATLEMQAISYNGVSCCMGYGDYPIQLSE